MYFEKNESSNGHLITAYDSKSVIISNIRYAESVLLLPGSDILLWKTGSFDALKLDDFLAVFAAEPDLLIIGSGNQQRFLSPKLMAEISQKKNVECMINRSACHTFNLLASEGRKVALALFMENSV